MLDYSRTHSNVRIGTLWCVVFIFLTGIKDSGSVSQRKIYSLFTTPKTWNEAHDICEDQMGRLVKLRGKREIAEVEFLDANEWGGQVAAMLTSTGFWGGLHRPFSTANDTWEYQDCEPNSFPFAVPTVLANSQHCGNYKYLNFELYEAACNEEKPFICQRFQGDCWYEPFPETVTGAGSITVSDSVTPYSAAVEAGDCAQECRDRVSPECWAFIWDPTMTDRCLIVQKDGITASSFFVQEVNRGPSGLDKVFYVRRCFEGVQDDLAYGGYTDAETTPNSYCSSHVYGGEPPAPEVCFCSTQDHPPIPPPLTSEAMAEQYANELTMDTSNTSSAQRKLTSAEDNRPSAIGVGVLGVGLLSAVFGGIFIMDIPVLYRELRDLFRSNK